ncbi:MAG: ABC transporter permease [Lachnospiraceae bacterium]|nr:ABC transporter permease [Lachnospiraceae bacterium]
MPERPSKPEMSLAQQSFLEERKRKRHWIMAARILLFLLFLALWEIAAQAHWIDAFIFSSPSRVCTTFWGMLLDKSIFLHVGSTLLETLVSFALVILLSLAIAVLLWLSSTLAQVLDPYLVILNSLPKSALAPLLIVWLGANQRTIVVAGMSVAIFGSILTIFTGFSQVDPAKIKLIYTLRGTRWDVLCKVVLPSSVPTFINTMKVNIGLCLVGVVIGEFIGSRQGLGYLIIYGSQVLKLEAPLTKMRIPLKA